MKLISTLPFILFLSAAVRADIQFLTPAAGSTAKGGDILTAHWKDSGDPPKLSELKKYDLFLCAGGDSVDSSVSISTPVFKLGLDEEER
jgi:hypothetical protein